MERTQGCFDPHTLKLSQKRRLKSREGDWIEVQKIKYKDFRS